MSGWFDCAQGDFPLDVASYRLERDGGRADRPGPLMDLPLLVGVDARRFLDQIAQSQLHIHWSQGGVPRTQARYRLLQTEALALSADRQTELLVSDEVAAVLRDLGVLRSCAG